MFEQARTKHFFSQSKGSPLLYSKFYKQTLQSVNSGKLLNLLFLTFFYPLKKYIMKKKEKILNNLRFLRPTRGFAPGEPEVELFVEESLRLWFPFMEREQK